MNRLEQRVHFVARVRGPRLRAGRHAGARRSQDRKWVNYWRKKVESFWGVLDEDFALAVSAQVTFASGVNRAL